LLRNIIAPSNYTGYANLGDHVMPLPIAQLGIARGNLRGHACHPSSGSLGIIDYRYVANCLHWR
jgi:hypothetical protein